MKKIIMMLAAFSLLIITSCSGGSDSTEKSDNNLTTVEGSLQVSSNDDATKYTVFNSNQSSAPLQTGNFSTKVAGNSSTYTFAISDNGKKVYAAVRTVADDSGMTINAQTTAEALVLLNPLLIPPTRDERIKIINIVRSDTAVKTLASVIENVYGSVEDPLSDPRISDALTEAVKSVLTTWQASKGSVAASIKQAIGKSAAFPLAIVRAASKGSSITIYPNQDGSGVDMGALTLSNSTGSTLKVELNSVGIGGLQTNVDWVVRIVELDPNKIRWFPSGPELYNPTDRTNIDALIKTGGYDQVTIVEGALASGLIWNLVADPIGKIADSINAKIIPDTGINLPHDGVYAVIALSGSPFNDSVEFNSVSSSRWQKSLWADAAGINMCAAAIDVVAVGTDFINASSGGSLIDISSLLELALASVKTKITNNPDYVKRHFIEETVNIATDLLDYLKPYIHSAISNAQSSGMKKFFHIAINTAQGVVDVWSGTILVGTRTGNFLFSVTPRESGYAVLGPFDNANNPTLLIDGVTSSSKAQLGTFSLSGTGYTPNGSITRYMKFNGSTSTLTPTLYADSSGNINWSYPSVCTTPIGTYTIWAKDDTTGETSTAVTEVVTANADCSSGYTITGQVTMNGAGLSGVTVTLTGAGVSSVLTDANGNYTFTNAENGTYVLSYSYNSYIFNPGSVSIKVNGENYTVPYIIEATQVFTISGQVTGAVLSGVTITLTGAGSASTATDANGNFSFINAANGNYTITPLMTGYIFNPTSRNITVNNANVIEQNFSAAEIVTWIGTKQFGTSSDDYGRGVVVDTNGNVYVTGDTRGGLDGNNNAGDDDIFLVKFDANGTKQWTRQLGSTGYDVVLGIAMDNSGNIYLTGGTQGGLDGNSHIGSGYYSDIFLVKYNSAGEKQWTKQFGTTSSDSGYGVAVDTSGNVYITGSTFGDLDGNTHIGSSYYADVFLVKYNSAGEKQWTKQFGTTSHDHGYGVAVDTSGNVYITGSTGGDLDGNTNSGPKDIFLVKYDSEGTKQWTRLLGSSSSDEGYSVAVDTAGNAFVTGYTGGNLDGNTNAGPGQCDFFLVKYDSGGTKQWTQQFGSSENDVGYGIKVDSSGNVYITGKTSGELDGNNNVKFEDIFVVKYDATGTKAWTRLLGSSSSDEGYSVAVDATGNAFVTGITNGNLDGNTKIGGLDVFLVKYNTNGVKQ